MCQSFNEQSWLIKFYSFSWFSWTSDSGLSLLWGCKEKMVQFYPGFGVLAKIHLDSWQVWQLEDTRRWKCPCSCLLGNPGTWEHSGKRGSHNNRWRRHHHFHQAQSEFHSGSFHSKLRFRVSWDVLSSLQWQWRSKELQQNSQGQTGSSRRLEKPEEKLDNPWFLKKKSNYTAGHWKLKENCVLSRKWDCAIHFILKFTFKIF